MTKHRSIFIVGIALALALAIFLFIPTKNSRKEQEHSSNSASKSLEQYRYDFINRQPDSLQTKLNLIESALSKADDSLSKLTVLTDAIQQYNQLQAPEIAALFVYKKAEIIRNTNSWEMTGDNFIHLLSDMRMDTTLFGDVSEYAIKSFEKSVNLDSNNTGAKMKLAQCYMELTNKPMDGVQLLLGIVRKDPKNVDAQLLLAKFGLVSGQIEKVMQRLENVLSLQPQNLDALLMRAEAYARSSQYDKAAKDLETVKNNAKTPQAMKAQLELAIKDLKAKK